VRMSSLLPGLLSSYRLFFCLCVVCVAASAAVPQSSRRAAGPAASSAPDRAVEEERLELERARFDFEKEKYRSELDERRRASHAEILKAAIGAAPFVVAIIGLWFESSKRRREEALQRESREKNEILQFQLKAAEITFDVRNSGEIGPKAAALAQLFPDRVPKDFAKNLNPDEIRFGPPTIEAKLKLLELLSQCSSQRAVILRIWGHMFPRDKDYPWFQSLCADGVVTRASD
jgi:hypothetical protein